MKTLEEYFDQKTEDKINDYIENYSDKIGYELRMSLAKEADKRGYFRIDDPYKLVERSTDMECPLCGKYMTAINCGRSHNLVCETHGHIFSTR